MPRFAHRGLKEDFKPLVSNNLKKLATKLKQAPLVLAVPVVMLTSAVSPVANAVGFDEQVQQLKQANVSVVEDKKQLSSEAVKLSETIATLQTETNTLNGKLSDTNNKVEQLKKDIVQSEKDLAEQRTALTLAAPKQDRSSLQHKVDDAAKRIDKLNKQLNDEKQAASKLQSDKKAKQKRLGESRSESTRLLGLNQQQQDAFEQSVKANADKIAQAEREKAVQNNKAAESKPAEEAAQPVSEPEPAPAPEPDPILSSASYPWASVPFPNEVSDPWGMYLRQCVSYTAWKVAASGRHMPNWGGVGNANQWDDNAIAAGIPVDTTPRVGDVAVMNTGLYGHVMYVEEVYDDGTIYISEYNYDLAGNYSERRISTAGLVFIHF